MENSYSLKASYLNTDVQTSELLGNFINGDTTAFSKLYNLHVNLLYNYGCKLTTDVELLKDCIQEVFIKIYNKRTELDTVANFKSYIIISLKNMPERPFDRPGILKLPVSYRMIYHIIFETNTLRPLLYLQSD